MTTRQWYVEVIPLGEDSRLEEKYLWGPFSTEDDAYTADRLFVDNEWLGIDLKSEVVYVVRTEPGVREGT